MKKVNIKKVLVLFLISAVALSSCTSDTQPLSQEQQLHATIAALETQVALDQQPEQATPIISSTPSQEQQLQATIVTLQTEVAHSSVSAMATPTSIPSPTPTSTPTSIPSPTPLLDTQPDTVLERGQIWRTQGLELRIKGPSAFTDGIDFRPEGIIVCTELKNNTPNQIIFKLGPFSDHVGAVDNRGMNLEVNTYDWRWGDQRTGWAFSEERTIILNPGETHPLLDNTNCWFVFADIGNPQVTYVIITLRNISRIPEAHWKIEISH